MILFIAPSGVVTSTLPVSLLEVVSAINLSVMLFCFSTARGAKQQGGKEDIFTGKGGQKEDIFY